MISPPTVLILLSTYNGERYLREQIESLVQQSDPHWKLRIRDDGSTDSTRELLKEFVARDSRIEWVEPNSENLGVVLSFGALLNHTDGFDSVMFCDQDDIWHRNKIERSRLALDQLTLRHGSQTPLLVHSDARVVNQDGKPLAESFRKPLGLGFGPDPLLRLIAQNFITGCTTIFNAALVKAALPIPQQALMHDGWLGLVAAAVGKIEFIFEPLLDYRQHSGNASGGLGSRNLLTRAQKFVDQPDQMRALMIHRFEQSYALEKHLAAKSLAPERAQLLNDFHSQLRSGFWPAFTWGIQNGVGAQGMARNAAYWYLIGKYRSELLATLQSK